MLSIDEVAAELAVSRATVIRLRERGDLPEPAQIGGRPKWRRSVIEAAKGPAAIIPTPRVSVVQIQELIRRAGEGKPLTVAQRAALDNADRSPAPESVQDAVRCVGGDLRDCALQALALDDKRREMIERALGFASGKFRPEDVERFANQLARLPGEPSSEILVAFDLAPGAGWGRVADRIEALATSKGRAAR